MTAHNFKGYDGYFVLQYMTKNGIKHNPIYTDPKIMTIKIESKLNMTFIDTLNFFPMPLSYVGAYPSIECYDVNSKNDKERTKLMEWHATVKEFNFEQELLDYCRNDVDILARSVIIFRKLMLEKTNVDPLNYVTIASTTMGVYKQNFLEEVYEVGPRDRRTEVTETGGLHDKSKTFIKSKLALVPSTGMTPCFKTLMCKI